MPLQQSRWCRYEIVIFLYCTTTGSSSVTGTTTRTATGSGHPKIMMRIGPDRIQSTTWSTNIVLSDDGLHMSWLLGFDDDSSCNSRRHARQVLAAHPAQWSLQEVGYGSRSKCVSDTLILVPETFYGNDVSFHQWRSSSINIQYLMLPLQRRFQCWRANVTTSNSVDEATSIFVTLKGYVSKIGTMIHRSLLPTKSHETSPVATVTPQFYRHQFASSCSLWFWLE